jgi:hypothetical protein
VMLASASKAIVIGFHTRIDGGVSDVAKREGVQIKLYTIIYELIDEVKLAMSGLLEPIVSEVVIGAAEVRQVFQLSKGVPVAYIAFPGEQHGFRRAETIKRALGSELYFYSRVFGFQPADAGTVDDVIGIRQGAAPFQAGLDLRGELVVAQVLLAELRHHVQVPRVDVVKSELRVREFGNRQQIAEQRARKTHAASPDESHFDRHKRTLLALQPFVFVRRDESIIVQMRIGAADAVNLLLLAGAETLLQETARRYRSLGDRESGLALVLDSLAAIYQRQGRSVEAGRAKQEAAKQWAICRRWHILPWGIIFESRV